MRGSMRGQCVVQGRGCFCPGSRHEHVSVRILQEALSYKLAELLAGCTPVVPGIVSKCSVTVLRKGNYLGLGFCLCLTP